MSAVRRFLPGRLPLWLLPLGLLGCPPKAPPSAPDGGSAPASAEDETSPEATEAGAVSEPGPRYVMLFDGATLASGFDATADTARAYDSQPDASATHGYWILRLIATHGEWLEVETVETDVHQCQRALPGLDGYALRLYVRTDETATVTRREVTVTVDGGNRVTLSPGVRVVPPERVGEATLALVDPPLPLAIPADAIGHAFAPPRRYDEGESVGSVPRSTLRLTPEIELPERVGWRVLSRRDEGPVAVITVAEPCVRYELHVPAAAVEEPQELGGLGGRGAGLPPRYALAADAPIYWANGERAGRTRRELERSDEPLRREVGRVCFAHSLTWKAQSADPVLVLCFDETDVRAVEPAQPSEPAEPADASAPPEASAPSSTPR